MTRWLSTTFMVLLPVILLSGPLYSILPIPKSIKCWILAGERQGLTPGKPIPTVLIMSSCNTLAIHAYRQWYLTTIPAMTDWHGTPLMRLTIHDYPKA